MNHFESKEWRTARLVFAGIDFTNCFCPGGSVPVEDGDKIAPQLNRLARMTRANGGTVVFTRDWHPLVTNHFKKFGGLWEEHSVANTFGAEFHKDLEVLPDDIIIHKGTLPDEDAYSGFQGADALGRTLEDIVTPHDNQRVILMIGGLATEYCDKATVLGGLQVAQKHGDMMRVIAVTDAMKAVNIQPGDGDRAIQEMQEAGAVLLDADGVAEQLGRLGLIAA